MKKKVKRFKDIVVTNSLNELLSDAGTVKGRAYMLQCRNGRMKMNFAGTSYIVKKDDLLFSPAERVPENVELSNNFRCTIFALEDKSVSDILYACLREEPSWLRKLSFILKNPIIHLSKRQVGLINAYRNIAHYYSEEVGHYNRRVANLQGQSIIYELLSWVDEVMQQDSHKLNEPFEERSRVNQLYLDFQQLLNDTHASNRKVQWYADQLRISAQYLNMICKQAVQKSPQKIIQELILKESKLLLLTTKDNIKQIAFRMNFSTEASFCKYFHKETGLTPTEFRKKKS